MSLHDRIITFLVFVPLVGCREIVETAYEWDVRMKTRALSVARPQEPPAHRRSPGRYSAIGSRLLPVCWEEVDSRENSPRIWYRFGRDDIQSVIEESGDPSRRSSAFALARKNKRGDYLKLEARTLQGDFHHTLMSELEAIFDFSVPFGRRITLKCTPRLSAGGITPKKKEQDRSGDRPRVGPKDKSETVFVLSIDPRLAEIVINDLPGAECSHTANTDDHYIRLSAQDDAPSLQKHQNMTVILRSAGVEYYSLPNNSALVIEIGNAGLSQVLRGELTFTLLCANTWDEQHDLFSKSHPFTHQEKFWDGWNTDWTERSKLDGAKVRNQSASLDIRTKFGLVALRGVGNRAPEYDFAHPIWFNREYRRGKPR